jgi:hypothetical protein
MFTATDGAAGKRRVPAELGGDSAVHLLEWLLGQAHIVQTEARHYAMEMFYQLVSRLPGIEGRAVLVGRYTSLAVYMEEVEDKAGLEEAGVLSLL